MSKREQYENRTEQLVAPIVEENELELVDVEYVKENGEFYLRVYIDKPGGVNIGDCESVSRALDIKLDEEDFIEDSYILEVSSPGLGRALKKEKDFVRSIGEEVDIHLYKAIDRQKQFTGNLKDFDNNTITIEFEGGETMTFQRTDISLVRLAFDF